MMHVHIYEDCNYYLDDDVFNEIKPGERYLIFGSQESLNGSFYKLSDKYREEYGSKTFIGGYLSSHIYPSDVGYIFDIYTHDGGGRLVMRKYYNNFHNLHNENGPAHIQLGMGYYYLNGELLSEKDWGNKMLVKLYW